MKKIFVLVVLLCFLLFGCSKESSSRGESIPVVCNKPYILVGTSCCLDKDDNLICDRDEDNFVMEESPASDVSISAVSEESEVDLEENKCGDGVCADDEDCEVCQEDCNECFSLSDLQADINKIIAWKIVLRKDSEDDIANQYVFSEPRARLLGLYPASHNARFPSKSHFKVLSKWYVVVSQIKDKEHYLKDSDEFYKYIINNRDYFLSPMVLAKEEFQKDFDNIKIMKDMLLDWESWEKIEDYMVVNISSFEISILDSSDELDTVGNRVVESFYVSADSYNVTYQGDRTRVKGFSGINFEYFISVYCSPEFVITLYLHDNYERTDYLILNQLKGTEYFLNDINNQRDEMLVRATALVGMCEQRYEFTYLRYR